MRTGRAYGELALPAPASTQGVGTISSSHRKCIEKQRPPVSKVVMPASTKGWKSSIAAWPLVRLVARSPSCPPLSCQQPLMMRLTSRPSAQVRETQPSHGAAAFVGQRGQL